MKKILRFLSLTLILALSSSLMAGCSAEDAEKAISVASQVAEVLEETEEADETEDYEETTLSMETEAYEEAEGAEDVESYEVTDTEELYLDPDGSYDSAEDVSLYLYLYGELPSNYITKKEAQNLGWSGGSLENYAPGKCIGGSNFGNYEGILPEEDTYHECDIDTLGAKSRGAKRIVFSNDGDIYYTEDHYETFTLLYTADGPATEEIVYGG